MKTKIATLGASFSLLSLLALTGVAWGLPDVETHSRQGWVHADPSKDPAQNPTLDLLKKVEFLQQEVQDLRGKVEEQAYQLGQLKDNQKKLYLDLDKRLQDGSPKTSAASTPASTGITIDSSEMAFPEPKAPENNSQGNGLGPSIPAPSTLGMASQNEALAEEKAYHQAYHLVQNKDYEGAKNAFRSLVKTFPSGKYTPNAHYWLGEIYMAKGDLSLAFDSFDSVYRHYPQHPKAADALLKLGYVEYAKGQWKRSQELLSQVKNQFPGSTSAQLADARLQRMHKEGHL